MPEKALEDLHPAPKWLTHSYMEDKLRKLYKDEQIVVADLDVNPATAKGDNYASVMSRVKVYYKLNSSQDIREESFIVKTTFGNNESSHKREMEMYDEILPKLTELLNRNGDNEKLFANTIHVDYDNSAIILEDLSESGFVMMDRLARLDINHTRTVLKKLAKIHATAAVLKEQDPSLFKENYDKGFFNRHTEAFKPMITGILGALTRYVKGNEKLSVKYFQKLHLLESNIMEYGALVFDPVEDDFHTLVHGDLWTNNILFKYHKSSNEPSDVIPIDFQFSSWASPAVDLHYLFNTSLREELRLHHQPELIQYYYNILASTLLNLSFKGYIPSLHEFCIQFEKRNFFSLFSSFVFQPIILCKASEDSEFSNLISNSESGIRFKDKLFKNPVVQEYIENLLPIFDQKGLLDRIV